MERSAKPGNRGRYNPRKIVPKYIWRPCIPSWEKEFTSKIGNIKWEDFVEARKQISTHKKIMDWKDSACEEAFTVAKKRFWDNYNGYESEVSLPDPDVHIDKDIDWNSEPPENGEDEDPMLSISDAEDDVSVWNQMPRTLPPLGTEYIDPTGWEDVVDPEITDLLTGLVVGDHD
ncbi:hypothetical protein POM88_029045 [Heracleum sosnowskyi]|uniref:Uncharacterized protein n=1 Tax=Heracleum sosnowskyi TaxID=360622 RepID=A0AAD8HUR0_9APIA|nr:hypothetical protein POM88_029045 [Heracleum sosnowskyi]